MKEGYYWFRVNHRTHTGEWRVCYVRGGLVHFFGEVSQQVGNPYLTEYVEFGDRIEHHG